MAMQPTEAVNSSANVAHTQPRSPLALQKYDTTPARTRKRRRPTKPSLPPPAPVLPTCGSDRVYAPLWNHLARVPKQTKLTKKRIECGAHTLKTNGIRIKPSTLPNSGLGLFANVSFANGDIITEYEGELVDIASIGECDERNSHVARMQLSSFGIDGKELSLTLQRVLECPDAYSRVQVWKVMQQRNVLLPVQEVGLACIANSCQGTDLEANARLEWVTCLSGMKAEACRGAPCRGFLKATRMITRGTEIFWSYFPV